MVRNETLCKNIFCVCEIYFVKLSSYIANVIIYEKKTDVRNAIVSINIIGAGKYYVLILY